MGLNTSSFRYSNLQMSFAETLSGSSALEAYQFSDYLKDSQQKFFVNLTTPAPTQNYSAYNVMNDTDNAFVNMIAEKGETGYEWAYPKAGTLEQLAHKLNLAL